MNTGTLFNNILFFFNRLGANIYIDIHELVFYVTALMQKKKKKLIEAKNLTVKM